MIEYHHSARRYEYGTRDATKVQGIVYAIDFYNKIGMSNIQSRIKYLASRLQQGLRNITHIQVLTPSDPTMFNGMVTFKCDVLDYMNMYTELLKYKFRTRIVSEQQINAVRVSTQIFNLENDISTFVQAVQAIVQAHTGGINSYSI